MMWLKINDPPLSSLKLLISKSIWLLLNTSNSLIQWFSIFFKSQPTKENRLVFLTVLQLTHTVCLFVCVCVCSDLTQTLSQTHSMKSILRKLYPWYKHCNIKPIPQSSELFIFFTTIWRHLEINSRPPREFRPTGWKSMVLQTLKIFFFLFFPFPSIEVCAITLSPPELRISEESSK